MKHIFCCVLLVMSSVVSLAQLRRPEGTIVRMSMTKCDPQGGFMAVMSGGGKVDTGLCPEYVLVADKVVHAISGKNSGLLVPLPEVTRFRLQKNEMLIRIDDSDKESHLHIKAMVLRPDRERRADARGSRG